MEALPYHSVNRVWSAAKVVVGIAAVISNAALVLLMVERAVGTVLGVAAVALDCIVVPIVLSRLLTGAFRKADSGTTFWSTLPGIAAILAILEVGAIVMLFTQVAGAALTGVARKHPGAGRAVGVIAGTLGGWLAPSAEKRRTRPPSPPPTVPKKPARWDAGTARPARRRDAGSPATATPDAGRREAPVADAAPVPAAPTEIVGSVEVCETVHSVFAVDLGAEPSDEIVVGCASSVHVLWPRPDGNIEERTRFAPAAPAGLERVVAEPRLADLDEDGRRDVLLCAYWKTGGGGTRGGDSWWARGLADGQFDTPARLVGGFCAGIDVGDVDSDGEVEIVLAHRGNPWMEKQPNGELRWFERAGGRRWRPAGRTPLHRDPMGVFLADANGDSTLDAVTVHGWDADDVTVCPGSPQGLLAIDAGIRAPTPPERMDVSARLDGDDRPDRLTAHGGILDIRRTGGDALRPLTRSLDYREYP